MRTTRIGEIMLSRPNYEGTVGGKRGQRKANSKVRRNQPTRTPHCSTACSCFARASLDEIRHRLCARTCGAV